MKEFLVKVSSYIFRKNYKMSYSELVAMLALFVAYSNIPSDTSTPMVFVYLGLSLGLIMLGTVLFEYLDRLVRNAEVKYLKKSLKLDNGIDIKIGDDVSEESIKRIGETIARLNKALLEKEKSQ